MIALAQVFVPDGEEARHRAEEELSRTVYAEAQPTWFDLLARDVLAWFLQLFAQGDSGRAGPIALIIVCVVVVAALIVALILWGRPRRTRAVRRGDADLLGARDDRSAARLRADAERAARTADWEQACVLRYRALARGLLERDLIDPAPGATAQAIAREAATAFPDETPALHRAASAFDEVRYLEHPATEELYRQIADTDARLAGRSLTAVPA